MRAARAAPTGPPRLHLVRHGRPAVDASRPASTWPLHPGAYDEVLAWAHPLPPGARWFTSAEPRARATADLLHPGRVDVVGALGEQRRPAGWSPGFAGSVERAFARPSEPAGPGWETLAACRDRVVAAVVALVAASPGRDLVLVGHGTAWTALAAALTGRPPDLGRWRALAMPDLVASIDLADHAGAGVRLPA